MKRKKILVVDDDKDLLLALHIRLTARGYMTFCAPDANWAIQMAVQEKPDLILLDLGLPDQNGFAVIEALKRLNSGNIPIIVVSARPRELYEEPSLLAGAVEYFEKPFDNAELIRAIQSVLNGSYTAALS
ncbi:MAG TPA: response regulator [candidate division Zixibacteria bacterium]|nr:response regulator [candidate division Zixibacteria bacterium]